MPTCSNGSARRVVAVMRAPDADVGAAAVDALVAAA